MGRYACCLTHKHLPKRLWSPDEDAKLVQHIRDHGLRGSWSSVPRLTGLQRCAKSCRLRWMNYLQPGLKHGHISPAEGKLIVHLHSILGNRWAQIALFLPGRTDNDIKKFCISTFRKKLKPVRQDVNKSVSSVNKQSDRLTTNLHLHPNIKLLTIPNRQCDFGPNHQDQGLGASSIKLSEGAPNAHWNKSRDTSGLEIEQSHYDTDQTHRVVCTRPGIEQIYGSVFEIKRSSTSHFLRGLETNALSWHNDRLNAQELETMESVYTTDMEKAHTYESADHGNGCNSTDDVNQLPVFDQGYGMGWELTIEDYMDAEMIDRVQDVENAMPGFGFTETEMSCTADRSNVATTLTYLSINGTLTPSV